MSNYYVRRSGEEDYLEHAGGWKWSKPTKYLTKLNIGGKVRYIYSQAQLAAARGMNKLANASGYSARRAMNAAKSRYEVQNSKGGPGSRSRASRAKATAQAYERRYNRSLLGRMENAGKKARIMVGNASKAARQAGQNFTGSIKKEAYRTGYRMKSKAIRLASQAKTNATRYKNKAKLAIDEATGAAAKRRAQVNAERAKNMGKTLRTSPAAVQAEINANRAKRKYENSLLGRTESARKAASERATSMLSDANRLGRKLKRKAKGLTTPKKAPRKPAKEAKVRDYAKITKNNEKSAEQYQYFDKDAGWATNSRAAAERLSGHKQHNQSHARRMRKRGRNSNTRITR